MMHNGSANAESKLSLSCSLNLRELIALIISVRKLDVELVKCILNDGNIKPETHNLRLQDFI